MVKKYKEEVKQLNTADWKEVYKHEGVPTDIRNFRQIFSKAKIKFACCLGLIVLLAALKMPSARKEFMLKYPDRMVTVKSQPAAVYKACVGMCEALAAKNEILVDEQDDIGGPLKAHGVIRQMCRIGVLIKHSKGVILGSTGNRYKIVHDMSDDSKENIRCFLFLHPVVKSILKFSVPQIVTLARWRTLAEILSEAYELYQIGGLVGDGYCSEWLTRTLLDGIMFDANARLSLAPDDRAVDLPGPDESGYLPLIVKSVGVSKASDLLECLGFSMPPHLFTMIACVAVPLYLKQKKKAAVTDRKRKRCRWRRMTLRPQGERRITSDDTSGGCVLRIDVLD